MRFDPEFVHLLGDLDKRSAELRPTKIGVGGQPERSGLGLRKLRLLRPPASPAAYFFTLALEEAHFEVEDAIGLFMVKKGICINAMIS